MTTTSQAWCTPRRRSARWSAWSTTPSRCASTAAVVSANWSHFQARVRPEGLRHVLHGAPARRRHPAVRGPVRIGFRGHPVGGAGRAARRTRTSTKLQASAALGVPAAVIDWGTGGIGAAADAASTTASDPSRPRPVSPSSTTCWRRCRKAAGPGAGAQRRLERRAPGRRKRRRCASCSRRRAGRTRARAPRTTRPPAPARSTRQAARALLRRLTDLPLRRRRRTRSRRYRHARRTACSTSPNPAWVDQSDRCTTSASTRSSPSSSATSWASRSTSSSRPRCCSSTERRTRWPSTCSPSASGSPSQAARERRTLPRPRSNGSRKQRHPCTRRCATASPADGPPTMKASPVTARGPSRPPVRRTAMSAPGHDYAALLQQSLGTMNNLERRLVRQARASRTRRSPSWAWACGSQRRAHARRSVDPPARRPRHGHGGPEGQVGRRRDLRRRSRRAQGSPTARWHVPRRHRPLRRRLRLSSTRPCPSRTAAAAAPARSSPPPLKARTIPAASLAGTATGVFVGMTATTPTWRCGTGSSTTSTTVAIRVSRKASPRSHRVRVRPPRSRRSPSTPRADPRCSPTRLAARRWRAGECDTAFAGGVNLMLTRVVVDVHGRA